MVNQLKVGWFLGSFQFVILRYLFDVWIAGHKINISVDCNLNFGWEMFDFQTFKPFNDLQVFKTSFSFHWTTRTRRPKNTPNYNSTVCSNQPSLLKLPFINCQQSQANKSYRMAEKCVYITKSIRLIVRTHLFIEKLLSRDSLDREKDIFGIKFPHFMEKYPLFVLFWSWDFQRKPQEWRKIKMQESLRFFTLICLKFFGWNFFSLKFLVFRSWSQRFPLFQR